MKESRDKKQQKPGGKVLIAASTVLHIKNFHLHHLKRFAESGSIVHAACGGKVSEIPFAGKVFEMPFRKSMISAANLMASIKLRSLIRREKYSLVCTHTSLAAFFTRLALIGMKERPMVINTVHGYLFDDNTPFIKRMILLFAEKLTAGVTDFLLVMNQCDLELAKKYRLGRIIEYIPGIGIDFSKLDGEPAISRNELRKKLGISRDAFVFIYPAEFSKRKNQQMLIRAMKLLPGNTVLVLPGDGGMLEKCRKTVQRLGLSGRIILPGCISDMHSYYAMADAAVSSSRSEGLPFNVLEAMYMGLPAAASKIKGHTDLIRDGENGLLFEYGNIEQCAEKMRQLINCAGKFRTIRSELAIYESGKSKDYTSYLPVPKENGKRRVCCFCEKWESGGIESFLRNIYTHMDLKKLEIDIVAAGMADSIFTEELRTLGVNFIELSGNTRKIYRNGRMFRKILEERNYDVVHLNIYHGLSLRYAKLAHDAGVRCIVHSHNSDLRRSMFSPLKMFIHRTAVKLLAQYADELWACSRLAAEFMFPEKLLKERGFTFIPNGIDVERFRFSADGRAEMRRELGVKQDELLVGNIGRLCWQKNQGFLLEVFAELRKIRPESWLLLAGDGEDKGMLERRTEELGISGRVIFYGVSSAPEKLLWAMDIFVLPSRFEGLPVAGVEAQAAGLPVLCASGLAHEICLAENFRFVSPGESPENWSGKIHNVKNNTSREDAADIIAAKGFSISGTAAKVQGGYNG